MRKGYVVLHGGDAFSPRSKQADHEWLQLIRRPQGRPRLAVVPIAAMTKQHQAAEQALGYYGNLGTLAERTSIVDALSANTEHETLLLDKVDALIFTDGSPIDMLERMRGSRTEAAVRRALLRRAAVMGTGASATVFGGAYWFADEWEPGLGLAPHLAVMPHHNLLRMRLSPDRLLARLPAGITLLGIDQNTVVVWMPDDSYRVEGDGTVTVYRTPDDLVDYPSGSHFGLDAAQPAGE